MILILRARLFGVIRSLGFFCQFLQGVKLKKNFPATALYIKDLHDHQDHYPYCFCLNNI